MNTIVKEFNCPNECESNEKIPNCGFQIKTLHSKENIMFSAGSHNNIIFLLKGKLMIKSIEREDFLINAGEMVFFYKKYKFEITAINESEIIIARFITAGHTCDLPNLKAAKIKSSEFTYEFTSYKINKALKLFLATTKLYLDSEILCKYMQQARVIDLFIVFRFFYPTNIGYKMFAKTFESDLSFRALVALNQVRAKTVEQLAKLCGHSLSQFKILFAREFSETPYIWMEKQKAPKVLAMITESKIPFKQIVAEFGFTDHGHLSRFCKKQFGKKPSEIRLHLV